MKELRPGTPPKRRSRYLTRTMKTRAVSPIFTNCPAVTPKSFMAATLGAPHELGKGVHRSPPVAPGVHHPQGGSTPEPPETGVQFPSMPRGGLSKDPEARKRQL